MREGRSARNHATERPRLTDIMRTVRCSRGPANEGVRDEAGTAKGKIVKAIAE
jgi:hypothetical protein